MNSKIIIPIAVAILVLVTAGIMYSIDYDQQPQVSEIHIPEIIYVDKSISEYFEGTHDIKKISSQEELENILEASTLFGGNFYDNRFLTRNMAFDDSVMLEMAVSDGLAVPSAAKIESGGADYSITNVQVANVDEPNYLKNDSKYVYIRPLA